MTEISQEKRAHVAKYRAWRRLNTRKQALWSFAVIGIQYGVAALIYVLIGSPPLTPTDPLAIWPVLVWLGVTLLPVLFAIRIINRLQFVPPEEFGLSEGGSDEK